MRTLASLAFGLFAWLLASDPSSAQQPKGAPPKSLIIYEQFRELVSEGRYDIAATFLKSFLDANPTEADFLEIEKKQGTTAFTRLRTIPKWSDDPAFDKQARENVEEAIKRARAATEKLLRDPARVQKYIRNLGATYEERVFAELELKRTGDYAVPFMVDELRVTRDRAIYDGILGAIPKLEPQTVAGFLAALDGLTLPQQYGVMTAVVSRPDILQMQTTAQNDIVPILWRVMTLPPKDAPTVRAGAERLLNVLLQGKGKVEGKVPVAELVAIARRFYEHEARYAGLRKNPAGVDTVPVWVWDATNPEAPKLIKNEEVPVRQADEYFGLRYARWALEAKPDYEPAQGLILAIAAERAIERAKFGNLATAEPGVYKLLADAPSGVLNDLLNRGLNQKKTALVAAMVQVLGGRGDRDAAMPPAGTPRKPSLLERALNYPDPAVQVAAANALLRSPVPVPPEVRGRIVEVLRRAAALDNLAPSGAVGTALIADPNKQRGDSLAVLLRGLGYNVEVFKTGRDLLRRVERASDFDIVFIDHHAANPELIDLIGQLGASANAGNRPTFVIASPDKPRVPTFDQLLVRFAALVASTENEQVVMPPPYVPDLRDTPEQAAAGRKTAGENRDGVFRSTAANRIARLQRVIDSTGVELTPTQKLLLDLRVELITYTILNAHYTISPESSPVTAARVAQIRRQIGLQPPGKPYGVGTPTTDLLTLMDRFEIDLARVPEAVQRFQNLYAKIDVVDLGLPVESFRDEILESNLARTLRHYPAVRIIPEPHSRNLLAADLATAQGEPGQGARDPAAKRADQKLAVEWLRKMATGELKGFEVKSAEPELRAALHSDALASDAIAATASFPSADAQQSLLRYALSPPPAAHPLPLRIQAADAVIQHIQAHGKLVPKLQIDQVVMQAGTEPDPTMNAKLQTLRGMLAYDQGTFANQLRAYNPPLVLTPPKLPVPPVDPKIPKDPKDPKDPKEGKAPDDPNKKE